MALDKNTPDHHPEWGNYHHFSFIVQNNKIIGYGTNKTVPKGMMKIFGYKQTSKLHSETNVFFKCRSLIGKDPFEIVNIRLTRTNKIRNSHPCECCMNFLLGFNCKSVYFTTDLETFAKIIL